MAERRMFTEKIVESDAFLEMPFSARCLYYDLNMNADDDGFLNSPNKIIRMCGASQDDLQLLIEKRYILDFGGGVIVIKHWGMHNSIRKDRKKDTQYKDQLALLEIKDDGSYTERKSSGNNLTTICQPSDNQVTTIGCHRLGKDRLGEDRKGKERLGEDNGTATPAPPSLSQISDYVKNNGLSVNPNRFFSYYNERDWKTPKGNPVDWESKLHEWDFDDKQKATTAAAHKPSGNPFLDLAKEENLF